MFLELINLYTEKPFSETLREAKGYTDLTNEEIYAAERAKYPKQMTLGECMELRWDFEVMDVDNTNSHNVVSFDFRPLYDDAHKEISDTNERSKQCFNMWNKMLDLPADFDKMNTCAKEYIANDYYMTIDDVASILDVIGTSSLISEEKLEAIKQEMLDKVLALQLEGVSARGYSLSNQSHFIKTC